MTEDAIKYGKAVNSERISFTCEPELAEFLKARAGAEDRTVSVVVRNILMGLYRNKIYANKKKG